MGDSVSDSWQAVPDFERAAVTIITPTYNKPRHLQDAGRSVFAQTHMSWRWLIVLNGPTAATREVAVALAELDSRVTLAEYPVTDRQRRDRYQPAVVINRFYPQVDTKYILWLSDDDVLAPDSLRRLIDAADERNADVVVGNLRQVKLSDDGREMFQRSLPRAGLTFGPGLDSPCDRVDGGQVLHTAAAYRACNWTCPEQFNQSTCCIDGLLLNQLAERFTFHLLGGEPVVTHRCTSLSTWNKG